jgi:hypothetical protein
MQLDLKDLKLRTKLLLYNLDPEYDKKVFLSESAYTLLHHFFGKGYMLKTAGRFLAWRRNPKALTPFVNLLTEIHRRVKTTPCPQTPYQAMYKQIKGKVLTKIEHILKNLQGIQGKPHERRQLRTLARKLKWGEYFSYQVKRGLNYQILSK